MAGDWPSVVLLRRLVPGDHQRLLAAMGTSTGCLMLGTRDI
jgi:hypothetical protein